MGSILCLQGGAYSGNTLFFLNAESLASMIWLRISEACRLITN